jgi:hypothetical protein
VECLKGTIPGLWPSSLELRIEYPRCSNPLQSRSVRIRTRFEIVSIPWATRKSVAALVPIGTEHVDTRVLDIK